MKHLFTYLRACSKPIRVAIYIVVPVLFIITLLLVFLSTILEFSIEKNSEKWIGRKVEMEDLSINLFTGKLTIHQLNFYEKASDTVFVSFERFSTNITLYKALIGKYEITELSLINPTVRIIQIGNHFNYDDLLALGNDTSAVASSEDSSSNEPIKYWVKGIVVAGAKLKYEDRGLGSSFVIAPINFHCKDIAWDDPAHQYSLELLFEEGGAMNLALELNTKTLDYGLFYQADKFNLSPFLPYLKPYAHIQDFGALFTTSVNVKGNFNHPENIAARANLRIDSLFVTDPQNRTVASFEQFNVQLDTLNTINHQYTIHHVNLSRPYFLVELFKEGTNFDKLLKDQQPSTSSATEHIGNNREEEAGPFQMLAQYVAEFAQAFNENEYKVLSTSLSAGEVKYVDYTLHDPFRFLLTNLQLSAGTFSSTDPTIQIKASSAMNQKGQFMAKAEISLKNYKDFVLNMDLTALPMSSFNPYSTYFVAHPFWDGDIYFRSHNAVKKSMLKSTNTLEVRKIEVGKKVKNNTAANVPVKFAVALLRDRKGNIAIDIPVDGNLNDPNYKVGRAILKIVTNLLVKAVASPFDLLASSLKCNPDDLKFIRFDYIQQRPSDAQLKNLDLVAKVIEEKPGISVELTQAYKMEVEKETWAVAEMKKRYFLQAQKRLINDTVTVEQWDSIKQISVTDSMFVLYCNEAVRNVNPLSTIQSKCRMAIGEKVLSQHALSLATARNQFVFDYLTKVKKVSIQKIKMGTIKDNEEFADGLGKFLINFFAD